MGNLQSRMRSLEKIVPGGNSEPLPEQIPSTWMEYRADNGAMKGPALGEQMTEGQRRTWQTLSAMSDCVPACEPSA